ncbi:MAG: hypothetical protein KAV68_01485 [Dehalococcoidales bacterium]|nr:hypothetical protein [Dehalococcoidales bacterium]
MIIIQLVITVCSFASLFGLIFILRPLGEPLTALQGGLLGFGICLLIAVIILQILNYFKTKPKSMVKESQIRDYIYKWISRGGRVAILSHDMSWVRDEDMKKLLRSKADCNELDLCIPREIALSKELQREGAQVHTFSELQYVPESRFTIINRGRMDAQVAVGRRIKGKHMIEEFSMGEHPIFSVANDLVNLIIHFDQWKLQQGKAR